MGNSNFLLAVKGFGISIYGQVPKGLITNYITACKSQIFIVTEHKLDCIQ